MGGEHDDGALRHLVGLLDEDRARLGQRLHDVHVVHDLVAHVHRRAVLLQCSLHGLDRAVDPGAVSARLGKQHPLTRDATGDRARSARNPHVDSRWHGSKGTDTRAQEANRRVEAMATAPYGVRLLVGAAVTAIEETRKIPQTILTYPMTVASQIAHLVMKMQQDVADLVIKGDETLESLFPPKDEQPEWATFDEDLDEAPITPVVDGERLTEGRFALFTGGEPETVNAEHRAGRTVARRQARPRSSKSSTTSRSPWRSCVPG